MKKSLSFLMVFAMLAVSVGCSSAPVQGEAPETTISAAEEEFPEEIPAQTDTSSFESSASSSTSDLSLGSGSSGRGH